jgi:hypothetical protein
VIGNIWKIAMALLLSVVTSCVLKWPIGLKPICNPKLNQESLIHVTIFKYPAFSEYEEESVNALYGNMHSRYLLSE